MTNVVRGLVGRLGVISVIVFGPIAYPDLLWSITPEGAVGFQKWLSIIGFWVLLELFGVFSWAFYGGRK